MALCPDSEEHHDLAAIARLPIPPYAVAWDPSIKRPETLPERYDTRIAAKYIFYLPSQGIYVVSRRCDSCAKLLQACDRALPGCARCVRAKKECRVSNKGYVKLPRPKAQRMNVLGSTSHVQKHKQSRASSERVQAKGQSALEHKRRQKQTNTSAGRPQQRILTPGRRKPGKARYHVLKSDTVTWDYICPSKNGDDPETLPFLNITSHTEQPNMPLVWAASQSDLLAALPTHPDIMQHHGLGYQGGFIDFLIIEGPTWEDDTWGERGTSINLTRHDAKWFSAKRRGYTDILLGCVCSKWRLARGRTTAKEVTSMNEGMPNDVEIASEADSNHNQVPSPDHSQHPSHSAPHPHGVELVLCPHLEPLEECLHCSVSYPDCSIAATSLDHGIYTDESDDTSSAASDAIFSSKYTSFFPTCGTINHAHVVDDCNLDDLSNDELSDDGVLPLPKVTLDDDGLAIWEDGQLFETSSEISCDDDLGLAEKRLNSSYAQESLHQVRHEAPHSGSTSIASFTPLTNSLGVSTGKHVAVQYGVAAPVGVTVNNGATGSGEIYIKPDELPPEAELFRNSLNTGDEFRVIVASNFSPLPFTLARPCAYAFLGFFVVVKFETILPMSINGKSDDTISLKLTLEWRHNGRPIGNSPSLAPWWQSLLPSTLSEHLQSRLDEMSCTFSNRPVLPGIPSYPLNSSFPNARPFKDHDDCSDEESDDDDFPPAWHCVNCGKLNMVTPFRSKWSWICPYCDVYARSNYKQLIALDRHWDPERLTPPLPDLGPRDNLKYALSIGPRGEHCITYKFTGTNILLQHIPSHHQHHVITQTNTLIKRLQADVEFQPVHLNRTVSLLSYHIGSRKAFREAPKAAQDIWCFMESLVMGRFGLKAESIPYARELTELRCTAWLSKGVTKGQEAKSGYTFFLSTGSLFILKVHTRKQGEQQQSVPLEMPHGGHLFFHNVDQPISYDVQHTGPSLLLAGRWISHAPKEELQVEASGRL